MRARSTDWSIGFLAAAYLIGVTVAISAVLILAGFLMASVPARAHGAAEWIQRGEYKNTVGELCCGERDCGVQVGGTIREYAVGYEVDADFHVTPPDAPAFTYHVKEFVPKAEATPSPDGSFWRCQWGGSRKCFFAPPGVG